MRKRAIIFDMDNVIAKTQEKHYQAESVVLKKYGIKIDRKDWVKFFGWKIEEILNVLAKKYKLDNFPIKKIAKEKNVLYLKLLSKGITRLPGAVKFIKNTKKYFTKTAVATSSKREQQEFIFKKLGIEKYFDVFVCGEDIKRGKPDPEIYLQAVRRLKFKPQECLVLEDSTNGIISAKKAGCLAIGITTSSPEQELRSAGADYVIKNYKELNELVKKL